MSKKSQKPNSADTEVPVDSIKAILNPVQLGKTRRTRNIFVSLIIFLILVVGVLAWVGFAFIWPVINQTPSALTTNNGLQMGGSDSGSAPTVVTYDTISIPNLVGFYGLTTDQILDQLGTGWRLDRITETTDPQNSQVAHLASYVYTPTVSSPSPTTGGGTAATANSSSGPALTTSPPQASLYASLDSNGLAVQVLFSADLVLLGYPEQPFMDLLANADFVSSALTAAGVNPLNFSYQAPDLASTLTYDNPQSANPKIIKQTQIFSGRASNANFPTAWAVTVTYTFVPAVQSEQDVQGAGRTMSISLS
ncbi:MAG: hypothetical protein FWC59_02655 [Actinomycetia bacterium]|nr:hypothetical protein [Actinomycetes bacterium]